MRYIIAQRSYSKVLALSLSLSLSLTYFPPSTRTVVFVLTTQSSMGLDVSVSMIAHVERPIRTNRRGRKEQVLRTP